MRASALFGAKTSNFRKFMVCPQEGRVSTDIFWTRGGRGSIFHDLCGHLKRISVNLQWTNSVLQPYS